MLSGLEIQEYVPLAPLTTLGVGGAARFFATARSTADVEEGVRWANARGLPLFVLGGGSNLLVADAGFQGFVLQNRVTGMKEISEPSGKGSSVTLDVGGGEDWDRLVEKCVTAHLAGFECLSGIPGTVGATPIQNVGAYGQEVSETIVSVSCIDRASAEPVVFSNADCEFSYRSSIFNTSRQGDFVVTSVRYVLERHGAPKVEYKDLKQIFAGAEPSLSEVRAAVLRIRAAKSMVIDPRDPDSRSAGSFFKNPIVSAGKLDELRGPDPNIPAFPSGENYKIPAAWLIEAAGISKGYCLGRAGISRNQALAIVNRGGATAEEIIVLRDEVIRRVSEKFGINLRQEPMMLGFE